jgi:hypothetical protein
MIRTNRPVRLLEWGEGTNTLNQVWTVIGEGTIRQTRQRDGLTQLVVDMGKGFEKKNSKDDSIKIAQKGEGMAARSEHWGEVAIGKLRSVDSASGTAVVTIEIGTAAKLGKAYD